ncbi:MAG: C69 family dipeptidase, partial [Brachybacterium sp.]|nr:C69 family dipeptidase [Brachybacterium sp.]
PLRYTSIPNALPHEGIWGGTGINAANVAMSATETITSDPRVFGADPLVEHVPAAGEPGTPEHRLLLSRAPKGEEIPASAEETFGVILRSIGAWR